MRINDIAARVAAFYNLKTADLKTKSRLGNVNRARQVAMYMIKEHGKNKTLKQIGDFFGDRRHCTVLHSINKMQNECNLYPDVLTEIQKVAEFIKITPSHAEHERRRYAMNKRNKKK